MNYQMIIPADFWTELERNVSSKVSKALNTDEVPLVLLIFYMRDLEVMARTACRSRQTAQIIASGRSLLGDRQVLGPHDCPFTYAHL